MTLVDNGSLVNICALNNRKEIRHNESGQDPFNVRCTSIEKYSPDYYKHRHHQYSGWRNRKRGNLPRHGHSSLLQPLTLLVMVVQPKVLPLTLHYKVKMILKGVIIAMMEWLLDSLLLERTLLFGGWAWWWLHRNFALYSRQMFHH